MARLLIKKLLRQKLNREFASQTLSLRHMKLSAELMISQVIVRPCMIVCACRDVLDAVITFLPSEERLSWHDS